MYTYIYKIYIRRAVVEDETNLTEEEVQESREEVNENEETSGSKGTFNSFNLNCFRIKYY